MSTHGVPAGYHSVTPFLTVDDASKLITFLQGAFGAVVTERLEGPSGRIGHAELLIGDSIVMISDATDNYPATTTGLYVYVEDVDSAYRIAMSAGAKSIGEPEDKFYGDRGAGVEDPCGNNWWIGTRIEDLTAEELKKRAVEARG
jgi:PhnB protein